VIVKITSWEMEALVLLWGITVFLPLRLVVGCKMQKVEKHWCGGYVCIGGK
jgi:hypothetical protein